MIAVVDYRVGNIRSVACALDRIGRQNVLTSDRTTIEAADGVILPGVGAFCAAVDSLRATGLDVVMKSLAQAGRPILGICLGLQVLFTESEEHGRHCGLDLLTGRVLRFGGDLKVPHMGWNEVRRSNQSPLFEGIGDGAFFYFAHSYYVRPEQEAVVIGATDYGGTFASAVGKQRLFGVQFHPEKSGAVGPEDIYGVLTVGQADAALVASIFHYGRYSIAGVKDYLRERGVHVRP